MRQNFATLAQGIAQHLLILGIARFVISRLSLSLFLHQLNQDRGKVVLGIRNCRVYSGLIITRRLGILIDASFTLFLL